MGCVPVKLYLGGGEVPSHRKLLAANHATHVSLSYFGLRRRIKGEWLVAEKFPDWQHILIDSGTYSINKHAADYEGREKELVGFAAGYQDFVAKNVDRADAFTEFDALPLGLDWIKKMREDYWDEFGEKFMPVWHAAYGLAELDQMSARYKRIAILQTALGDRDLVPALNLMASRRGTLFHGLAMTKPAIMREVRWDSVGSTSWISPMQFGDTQIWVTNQMRRYPKDYKEESRREHRALFERNGFDADKILADDSTEVAKLTLWSWQQLMDDLNRRQPELSFMESADLAELRPVLPVPQQAAERVLGAVQRARSRERVMLPGVRLIEKDGQPQLENSGESLRQCDTCFLKDRGCPLFEPGAVCGYAMPPGLIKTASDIKALENALIAMQVDRVTFMRMVEDLDGGFPDPNLSTELDRLTRMIKLQREGTSDKFSLSINASRAPGEAGILGSMFGANVASAQTIKVPAAADEMIKASVMADAYGITEKK
jgi:hypothetical protein